MSRCVLWLLLAVGFIAACKRKEPAPAAAAAMQAELAARGAPVALPDSSIPVVVAENSNMDATLAQLSTELHRYVARTRSVPKDFEDFAAKARVQAPTPPAGKKYAIKEQAVVLVRR